MADTRSETTFNTFSNCSGKVIESVCEKCHDYETQLKNVLDELHSAQRSFIFYKASCFCIGLQHP